MDTTPSDGEWTSESSQESEAPTCTSCQIPQTKLSEPLKRCGKCKTTQYCSKECQKEDWKSHKRTCGKPADQHNPGFHIHPVTASSFRSITSIDYLHSLPETDVFTQLIDCYRLRVEDEYTFKGDCGALYAGRNPMPYFKRFLDKAEKTEGVLPKWWSKEKRTMCEKAAVGGVWADINFAVEKSDIVKHYGDPMMPMALRLLAERIYGKGLM